MTEQIQWEASHPSGMQAIALPAEVQPGVESGPDGPLVLHTSAEWCIFVPEDRFSDFRVWLSDVAAEFDRLGTE